MAKATMRKFREQRHAEGGFGSFMPEYRVVEVADGAPPPDGAEPCADDEKVREWGPAWRVLNNA